MIHLHNIALLSNNSYKSWTGRPMGWKERMGSTVFWMEYSSKLTCLCRKWREKQSACFVNLAYRSGSLCYVFLKNSLRSPGSSNASPNLSPKYKTITKNSSHIFPIITHHSNIPEAQHTKRSVLFDFADIRSHIATGKISLFKDSDCITSLWLFLDFVRS